MPTKPPSRRPTPNSNPPPKPKPNPSAHRPVPTTQSSPKVPSGKRRTQQLTTTTRPTPEPPVSTSTTDPASHSHSHSNRSQKSRRQRSVPAATPHGARSAGALEAREILSNPRLQQATGLLTRTLGWFDGMKPTCDELARLRWAMDLPDLYPAKRPRGNF